MRFVAVKSEEQQAAGFVFRTRDLLVRQRTQLINAIRGHLAEYGWVAPQGPSHVSDAGRLLEDRRDGRDRFRKRRAPMFTLDGRPARPSSTSRIAELDTEIARRASEDEVARRLMTIPGIGPITATAIVALAPPAETFAQGPRLRRLARPHAAPALDRRQAEARATSRRWASARSGACSSSAAARSCNRRADAARQRLVAGADAGAQAAHAGHGRARQQDGAHRLGAACQAGRLQSSGRSQA